MRESSTARSGPRRSIASLARCALLRSSGAPHRHGRPQSRRAVMTPEMSYPRRRTRAVRVGDAVIGGDAPILVQSMITEETRHVDDCVAQIIRMYEAGCELVRVTTPTMAEAHCLGEIKARLETRGYRIPLVADVHHQGT